MTTSIQPYESSSRRGVLRLAALTLGLSVAAVVLYSAAGLPRLPESLPGWHTIAYTLRGSDPPLAAMSYLLTLGVWAVWFWIAGSIVLRLIVVSADVAVHGPRWVRSLRVVSDRVTLPIVRHLVDGALVAAFVINLAGRPAHGAAAPITGSGTTAASILDRGTLEGHTVAANVEEDDGEVIYTVQPGDTLWAIAERFFGSGFEYPRIVEANAGRVMADGRRFTSAGVIHPGWELIIPVLPPSSTGGEHTYVVKTGDTLASIAEYVLGNSDRWPEIFELNRGKAALPNGEVLTDPDLIWPGLELRLPIPDEEPVIVPDPVEQDLLPPPLEEFVPPIPDTSNDPPLDASDSTSTPSPSTPREGIVVSSPESGMSSPTPTVVPTPSRIGEPVSEPEKTDGLWHDREVPPIAIYGGAAAAAALAGGSALLLRRRVRRSLSEPPVRNIRASPPLSDDFAGAEFTRLLTHRLDRGDAELVVLVAGHILRVFNEQGVRGASVVMARQGPRTINLTLGASSAEQEHVFELAEEIATRLGGKGWAAVTRDRDISLHLSGLAFTRLIAAVRPPVEPPRMLPLGMLPNREVLYANWNDLGHVLVAGLPGGGTEVVLTSLVAALAARCRPDELRLWTIASQRTFPLQLLGLPHQCSALIDPNDEQRVSAVVDRIRTEIVRRTQSVDSNVGHGWSPDPDEPEIVIVMGELGDLGDDGPSLEFIATHGPAVGVRLLAGATHADAIDDGMLAQFGSRLVLQTLDDGESIRLLGEPQAADLGSGELLVRVDGRGAIRAHAFRITAEHLDALLRAMRVTGQNTDTMRILESDLPAAEESQEDRECVSPDDGVSVELARAGDFSEPAMDESATPDNRTEIGMGAPSRDDETQLEATRTAMVEAARAETEALLHVRCFGEFEVTSGDRVIRASDDEGASYKAWEILAFLAAQPDGAVSKETLITAVWPDVEPGRAANRMRVAMARLRALLARQIPGLNPEVVRCERDGTCRMDSRLVWSDAWEFLKLCQVAAKLPPSKAKVALEQARDLYRGDLLSGRGTRFYEWVEDRAESGVSLREHFREEYYQATLRLARLYREEGQLTVAVPLYKCLLRTEPTLEDIVRELYRCYQQLGDLSSLLRQDRELRQALREAYLDPESPEDASHVVQPESETVALFNEIRTELKADVTHDGPDPRHASHA